MIQVQGLTKRYGQTTAVEDLTFDVQPDRVVGNRLRERLVTLPSKGLR